MTDNRPYPCRTCTWAERFLELSGFGPEHQFARRERCRIWISAANTDCSDALRISATRLDVSQK